MENCSPSWSGLRSPSYPVRLENSMDLRSSKKGVTITVKDVEQSSLRLWVHHLLTSLTKTIYSSDSEKVQFISSPQIYFSPEQSSLHLAAEVVRALDSGMMVPVQVGNNEDDWCDIIGRTGPTLTTPSERSPPLSWTLTLLLFHRALPDYQRSLPPQ